MDKDMLDKYLKLFTSGSDTDAAMGLRGAQALFSESGASLEDGLRYAAQNIDMWSAAGTKTIDQQPSPKSAASAAVTPVSGMPECRVPRPGCLEIVLAGKTQGDVYALPGESANDAETIAVNLKDAAVAAVINKSAFKLKLSDVKNGRGEILETLLQAEYERQGMTPVRIWANNRGEVGLLAAVLRKAVAASLPGLLAA